MKNIDYKTLPLIILAAGVFALGFAYTAQYGFNLQPCILCLYQRKPYFAVIILGLLAIAFRKNRKAVFALLLLSGIAFLIGTGISGFHAGVEYGWWTGLQSCGDANLPENASVDELREYLANRPIVRCDVAGWKMFGISMSGYNFLYSTLLTFLTFIFAFKGRPK